MMEEHWYHIGLPRRFQQMDSRERELFALTLEEDLKIWKFLKNKAQAAESLRLVILSVGLALGLILFYGTRSLMVPASDRIVVFAAFILGYLYIGFSTLILVLDRKYFASIEQELIRLKSLQGYSFPEK